MNGYAPISRVNRGSQLSRLLRLLPGAVLGVSLLLGLTGCDPEKHYETLSFFFDGVPDPNAPVEDLSDTPGAQARRRLAIKLKFHPPYAEEKCNACHLSHEPAALMPDASVCLTCHAQVPEQFQMMHGPVAAGSCLTCHNPHQSTDNYLLRRPARQMCASCHEPPDTLEPLPPAHLDPEQSCINCHHGHGGDNPYFLREPGPEQTDTEQTDAEQADQESDPAPSAPPTADDNGGAPG